MLASTVMVFVRVTVATVVVVGGRVVVVEVDVLVVVGGRVVVLDVDDVVLDDVVVLDVVVLDEVLVELVDELVEEDVDVVPNVVTVGSLGT